MKLSRSQEATVKEMTMSVGTTVQISSSVFWPWICCATRPGRSRNLMPEYVRAPTTIASTTTAAANMIQ